MKHSASKALSLIFLSLGIGYLLVILGFNSVYNHLFVHTDNRRGIDHRTKRNMFHQFSKENYFHKHNGRVDEVKKETLPEDDGLMREEIDVLDEIKPKEENMIVISQEENHNTITPMKIPNNLRTVDKEEKTKSKLGSLSCKAYGGPDDEFAQKEMVYWSDIPEDEAFVSPYKKHDKERYLTFEPDGGGWNNIRMAMETVVAMAHAMGRTLVMPPSQHMYLLNKGNREHNFFSFADFYHLEDLASEHLGIKIISMEDFLKRTAMQGLLVNRTTGAVSFPPDNRTDWNGRRLHEKELWEYLRDVTDVRNWKPDHCVFAFPSSPGKETAAHEVSELQSILNSKYKSYKKNPTKPVPVNATVKDRLTEMSSGRKKLCVYDANMQESLVVHFMCYWKQRARLLTHFYTFLFFENYQHDLWTKRFVRDHLRYVDSLQCAAARVVHAIREKVKASGNPEGTFDSFHVRRGDFQYKETRVEASELLRSCKNEIPEGSTVYVATDERNKDFFKPLTARYHLLYLDDFKDLIQDVNQNHYGMLDQLIASKGRVFFGTHFSTFTGFIDRMRGYHVGRNKEEGYEDGLMLDSYFFLPEYKDIKRKYARPRTTFSREFAIAWRDIDHGINT